MTSSGDFLNGDIDEFRIYDKALNADEVGEVRNVVPETQSTTASADFEASFEGGAEAIYDGKTISPRMISKMVFKKGALGDGAACMRFGYDSINKLGYHGLNKFFDSALTVSLFFIPDWNGDDGARHVLLNYTTAAGA